MRNEELAKLTRVGYPTSSGARGKTQAQARRKRACRVKGQSPLRSLRQSLIRRKPTRCRFNEKKAHESPILNKGDIGAKICTVFPIN